MYYVNLIKRVKKRVKMKKFNFILMATIFIFGIAFIAPKIVAASDSIPHCSDSLDNDGDGLTDFNDPACHNGGVVTDDTYVPNNESEVAFGAPCPTCGNPTTTGVCSNNIDDDADGFTDALDPGCHTDGDASNPASYDRYKSSEVNIKPVVVTPPTPVKGEVLGAAIGPVTQVPCGTARPCTLQKTGGMTPARIKDNVVANKVAQDEKNSLTISKLGVDKSVLQLKDIAPLRSEFWVLPWTSTPEKGGNTVVVGHAYNNVKGKFTKSTLYELDTLKAGDEIIFTWKGTKYTYVVSETKKVSPNQIEIEDQTANPTLTIYSCGKFTNKIRTVVVATLKI
jgi:LPXTG-site transpeptidase (sortase) family protein